MTDMKLHTIRLLARAAAHYYARPAATFIRINARAIRRLGRGLIVCLLNSGHLLPDFLLGRGTHDMEEMPISADGHTSNAEYRQYTSS